MPPLPRNILKAGQIVVDGRLCVWGGVPIPPLQGILGYRRFPVQAPYPPLLGALASVTLADSLEFPLH